MSLKAMAPGGGRRLVGKDFDGNLYFEKPDPNGNKLPFMNSFIQEIFLKKKKNLKKILFKELHGAC